MRLWKLVLASAALMAGNAAKAQDLPTALVDFVNVCVLPRLEGRQPDYLLLNERFKPSNEQGTSYSATSPSENYSLILSRGENGTCTMTYNVPNASQYGSEFFPALRELKKNYYKGQIGPPAKPGSGFTAISMRGPKTGFDVVYSFVEQGDRREIRFYTN